MATVRKSDPTIPTPTIHTEKLSGVIKIFAMTERAAMLIAEAEYFMVRDVNFGGDQPPPVSSWLAPSSEVTPNLLHLHHSPPPVSSDNIKTLQKCEIALTSQYQTLFLLFLSFYLFVFSSPVSVGLKG